MPLNFPTSPQTDDVYTYGERSWKYNGRAWIATGQIIGYTGSRGYTGSASTVMGYTGSSGAGYTGSAGPTFINLYTSCTLYVFEGVRRWYAPSTVVVTSIIGRMVGTANQDVIFAIKKNGQTQATLTVPTAQLVTATYTTPFTVNEGEFLTVSIIQVGTSSAPGNDLYVQIKYRPA